MADIVAACRLKSYVYCNLNLNKRPVSMRTTKYLPDYFPNILYRSVPGIEAAYGGCVYDVVRMSQCAVYHGNDEERDCLERLSS